MRLADILDTCGANLVTVTPETSLAETAQAMHKAEANGALVIKHERLQGVLTQGDIVRTLTTATSPILAWKGPVKAAIIEGPEPLSSEEPVGLAIARMTEAGIDHLPVITAQGIVIVSLSNVLLAENAFLHCEVQHLQTYIDALHDAPND